MRRLIGLIGGTASLAVLAACQTQRPKTAAPVASPGTERRFRDAAARAPKLPSAVLSASAPTAAAPPPSLEAELCGDDQHCQVMGTLTHVDVPDGKHSLVLVRSLEEVEAEEGSNQPPPAPCTLETYFLIAQDARGAVTRKKVLGEGCMENSPSDSWCGLPPRASVEIKGAEVSLSWYQGMFRCMGAYRSSGTELVSLASLWSLRSETMTYRNIGYSGSITEIWDWRTFSARKSWDVDSDECPDINQREQPSIVRIDVSPEFVESAWRSASMQECSSRLDSKNGVALGGAFAKVALRTVLAHSDKAEALFIEVEPEPGQALPDSAVIKICTSEYVVHEAGYCKFPPEKASCTQLGLDGKVQSGAAPVERSPTLPRFKVTLPVEHGGLTVAYLDRKTGRSLSTSRLIPRDSLGLSEVFDLDAKLATCKLDGDALRLVRNPEEL